MKCERVVMVKMEMNLSMDKLGRVHTTPVKCQNVALFLWLGLPSTLIRHENRAFRKTLFKPDEFENAGFDYGLLWTENILKTKVFKNDYLRLDNHVINPNPQGCSQALLRW